MCSFVSAKSYQKGIVEFFFLFRITEKVWHCAMSDTLLHCTTLAGVWYSTYATKN